MGGLGGLLSCACAIANGAAGDVARGAACDALTE
jgi:hypothetical protein